MRKYEGRRGVKSFNLFNKTWKIGRFNQKKDSLPHVVIYGPEDEEYHAYGAEAESVRSYSEYDEEFFIDKTKAKIYVLTSILDKRENWCFDLSKVPEPSIPVKVVFEDATIRWIGSFSGDWKNHLKEIQTKIPTDTNPEWLDSLGKDLKDKNGNRIPSPSQFIWIPKTEYKNIIAWKQK
jgi:hypothetical protein